DGGWSGTTVGAAAAGALWLLSSGTWYRVDPATGGYGGGAVGTAGGTRLAGAGPGERGGGGFGGGRGVWGVTRGGRLWGGGGEARFRGAAEPANGAVGRLRTTCAGARRRRRGAHRSRSLARQAGCNDLPQRSLEVIMRTWFWCSMLSMALASSAACKREDKSAK